MKKLKLTLGILLGMLAITVALTGCSGFQEKAASSSNASDKTIKIRFAPYPTMASTGILFGVEKGIFAKAGVELEMTNINDKVAALISDSIDIADYNTSQSIVALSNGAPVTPVGSMWRTKGAWHVVVSNDIQTVADLKGKKISSGTARSGQELTIRELLSQNGLDPDKDVQLVATESKAAYANLENKEASAIIVTQPYAAMAEEAGIGHTLSTAWKIIPQFHTGLILTSNSYKEKNPEAVRRFLQGYYNTYVYAKNHLDEFIAFAAKTYKVPEPTMRKAIESEIEVWDNDLKINLDNIKATQELQLKWKFQKNYVDISKKIDESFLPANYTYSE